MTTSRPIGHVAPRGRRTAAGGVTLAVMRRAPIVLAAVVMAACTSVSTGGAGARTPTHAAHSHTARPSSGAATSRPPATATSPRSPATTTTPSHVVVVIEENHSYGDIIGNSSAPYMNSLASTGRSLTQMYATTHPSEPNYLALFSGSTKGITDDSCPHTFSGSNLGNQLLTHHRTFVGYAESLPSAGSTTCLSGEYARKHAPWVDFSDLPAAQTSKPFTAFPTDYTRLPTVAFVVPNLADDMHDGTIAQADTWLHQHLSGYATWAKTHNSQLIVTWDEDDQSANNRIPTIITGAGVTKGTVTSKTTAYSLLRLLEDDYGLPHLGGAASAPVIPLG